MPQRVRARWRRAPIEAYGDGGAKRGGEQSVGAPSPTPTAHCAEGWIVAGSAMRYHGADAGWERPRTFVWAAKRHGASRMVHGDRLAAADGRNDA